MSSQVTVYNRCLYKVYPSLLDEYDYQCFEHDEDLYKCETHEMNEEEYLRIIATRIKCPIEDIKEVQDQYDAYIMNNFVHDDTVTVLITLQEFYEIYMLDLNVFKKNKKSTLCNHLLQI